MHGCQATQLAREFPSHRFPTTLLKMLAKQRGAVMSRPLRLVPQAAQPIEFCCPLCGSIHAAYIFGTSHFRIFRCGGCALTFSKKSTRSAELSPPKSWSMSGQSSREEQDYECLLASMDAALIDGPVLVVGDPED